MRRITINGQPLAQKRHRTNGYNRYDPSATDKKNLAKLLLPIKPPKPLEGIFELRIIAFFQTPTSWSGKKKDEVEGKYRGKTPDTDNIAKIVMDTMNNYIIEDDRYIVKSTVEKRYSMNPRTVIELDNVET